MALIYRITRWGPPDRGGTDAPVTVEIAGLAKTNDLCRYTIFNEVVCEHLGRCLGLPVPVGIVARDNGGKAHYISLDVSAEGRALPPIVPADFVAQEPWGSAGCVAFDILVANGDRHAESLARDTATEPPQSSLFDHGGALLGSGALPNGMPRLRALEDTLGCDGTRRGVRHVLLDELQDADALELWVGRIEQLPQWVFEDACSQLTDQADTDATPTEKDELVLWLLARARNLRALIVAHQEQFTKVQAWGLFWEGGT